MIRTTVAGAPVDALTRTGAEAALREALRTGRGVTALSVNPEIVLAARRDPALAEALARAVLLLPDGTGVVWALLLRGLAAERVPGADMMESVLDEAAARGLTVRFVIRHGGLSGAADISTAVRARWPALRFAVEERRSVGADGGDEEVIIVNFGAPHQERWIARFGAAYPKARLLMAVGGGLDFLTGRVPRAPRLMQRLGLEWLWRLVLQPRRLWRIVRAVIIFPLTVLFSSRKPPMPSSNTIRVRFAPSPTGYLHIGGLRTALYNALFARKHGGVFALRIEDTDRSRLVPGAAERLMETLTTMGLTWDEGPVVQSERLALYDEHLKRLVDAGKAYPCFCTSKELEAMRQHQAARKEPPMYDGRCRRLTADQRTARIGAGTPHVIRLAVPRDRAEVAFTDAIRGDIRFPTSSIDDAVLSKSDGFPTYHLANVVDDHDMRISHVIRGEEWISSTPKHVLLYEAFGWTPPVFAHLPLLLNADRSKLSKRQGDVAVEDYLAKGYLPEALINFVALLGWNPTGEREIYAVDELAQRFDLAKVNPSGAVVNFEKLDWLNAQYLRALPEDRLAEMAAEELRKAGCDGRLDDAQWLAGVVALAKDRLVRMPQLPELVSFLFRGPAEHDPSLLIWKKSDLARTQAALDGLAAWFETYAGEWSAAAIEGGLKAWIAAEGLQNGDVLWPLRVALTGLPASPGPFEIAPLLSRDDVVRRIRQARSRL